MHEGKCRPQEAACLINGVNPDECIMQEEEPAYDEINQYKTAYVRMADEKLQHIVEVLCDGSAKWWLYRNKNIFEHVDKAIKNNLAVSLELMNTIDGFVSNYLPVDYDKFTREYLYINRMLESTSAKSAASQKQHAITPKAKYARWRIEANQIYSDNPKFKKYRIVTEVCKKLSAEAPEF